MCFLWKNINLPQGSEHRVMEHPFLAQFRASSMRQKHRASSLWRGQRSWQPDEAPFYRWEQMPKPLQRPSSSHTSTPVALCLLVCDWSHFSPAVLALRRPDFHWGWHALPFLPTWPTFLQVPAQMSLPQWGLHEKYHQKHHSQPSISLCLFYF